jgi:hypothetical protein
MADLSMSCAADPGGVTAALVYGSRCNNDDRHPAFLWQEADVGETIKRMIDQYR